MDPQESKSSSEPIVQVPAGLFMLMARCYFGNGPRDRDAPPMPTADEIPSPRQVPIDPTDPNSEGELYTGPLLDMMGLQSGGLPAGAVPKGFAAKEQARNQRQAVIPSPQAQETSHEQSDGIDPAAQEEA